MKFTKTTGLLALASCANAFPTEMYEQLNNSPELEARAAEILERQSVPAVPIGGADDAAKIFEPIPIWNKEKQYINIGPGSGHEFVAPGVNDQRGPCPGLNAFANHGFLPHDGYATIAQFLDATMNVVGMGPGLAGFLAVFGAAVDGSGTAWSIGGTPFKQGKAGGNGLSNSHNKYEGDASPTRPDLYEEGNDYKVKINQYQQLANLSPQPSNFDIPTLTKFRSQRFDTQVANNANFFNGPFSGVLVQPAAYTFIYRFMANHTKAKPEGVLNRQVFQSWFSITGSNNAYNWVPGHEKIPNNWYRRPIAYPYDQGYFFADVANAAKLYPKFLNIGGNTGTKNSFTGVNVANLNGGIINGKNLLQGNNFACLAYQFAAQTEPDILLNAGIANMQAVVKNLQGRIACPQLAKIDDTQLKMFPGYNKAGQPYS